MIWRASKSKQRSGKAEKLCFTLFLERKHLHFRFLNSECGLKQSFFCAQLSECKGWAVGCNAFGMSLFDKKKHSRISSGLFFG